MKKCLKLLKEYLIENNIQLELPTEDIIELCDLCTNQVYFSFNNDYYKQLFGLPMGSPLSGALACLYLEILEAGPIKEILPKNCTYLRYIDDTLVICPKRTKTNDLLNKLNNIDQNIQFTFEEEENCTLPFLDILIHNKDAKLQFSVFRKKTNKNDLLNYYSDHDTQIKRGMLIGFFLRALRICSEKYIETEYNYIIETFKNLSYPEHFIRKAKQKAIIIMKKQTSNKNENNEENIRRIVLPTGNFTNLKNILTSSFQIIPKTSETIKKLTRPTAINTQQNNGIYKIDCYSCDKCYIGETYRDLGKRIKEHTHNLKTDNELSALVTHRNKHDHNFKLKEAKIIHHENDKKRRRILEAAVIATTNTIKQKPGFFQIANPLAHKLVKTYKINVNK